jgi:hypothetical protein
MSNEQTGFSEKRLSGARPEETREMLREAPLTTPAAQQSAVPGPKPKRRRFQRLD